MGKRARDTTSLEAQITDTATMPATKKHSSAHPREHSLPSPTEPAGPQIDASASTVLQAPQRDDTPAAVVEKIHEDSQSTSRANNPLNCQPESYRDCVRYWASESSWPREYFDPRMPSSGVKRARYGEIQPPFFDWNNDMLIAHFESLESFMDRAEPGPNSGPCESSLELIQKMISTPSAVPEGTTFSDPHRRAMISRLKYRNETTIYRDLTHHLILEAECYAELHKSTMPHLQYVVSISNDSWIFSQPIIDVMPKPNYTVGFDTLLFNSAQRAKLKLWQNEEKDNGAFHVNPFMWFPFLVCELKTDKVGIDLARRQNLHSTTIAMRDLVDLFRTVGMEKQIDHEVLMFSVSHTVSSVQVHGHYADTTGPETKFWQSPILGYDIQLAAPGSQWACYTFTRNLYDLWLPIHL